MKKTKVLFKMFYLYHKAAFDPLIELFERDPKYDVSLSLTHEIERTFGLFDKDQTKKYLQKFEKEGHRISDENENYDIVFAPDVVDEKKYGSALICLIWHGITFTKTGIYRELKKHTDYRYVIFAEGEQSVQSLMASGSIGNSEVYKVGYPKMDPYFTDGNYDRNEILISLGLDPDKPTVLFAPTYKPTCIYELKDVIFRATKDYNLIIKLHHYAWMGKYTSHRQHKIFEKRVKNYPHAVIIPKDDYSILPLLYIADTLVSEASGAITEFLATGKTGVIYNLNQESLKHSDGEALLSFDNREYLKDSFVHINSTDNLRDGIKHALHPTPEMKRAQKADQDKIFFRLDGNASKRTKAIIELLLAESGNFSLSG
ncbi:MAG TPA: CDP-glycerol glycerophosphotransferase [Candidatus Marinimicrobia bacterium]|jgi:CDP-glycerol glycerophosphotransferase (TagB/SpsB family)|nr:CDP-glycerol glycerophosphotransferase [Candidatus Neomarinimicrobiota bacterium]